MSNEKNTNSSYNHISKWGGTYELPEIGSDMICPNCSAKSVHMTRTLYNLPDGDEVLILLLECDACSYKKNDIVPMITAFKPGEYNLFVDDKDFTHKIFRGTTGDLEIPEIGVTIERGPAADFDFTNIEGILLKIQDRIEFFLNSTTQNTQEWINAHEAQVQLSKCLTGDMKFHVILRDKVGGSYISPSNTVKMTFSECNDHQKL